MTLCLSLQIRKTLLNSVLIYSESTFLWTCLIIWNDHLFKMRYYTPLSFTSCVYDRRTVNRVLGLTGEIPCHIYLSRTVRCKLVFLPNSPTCEHTALLPTVSLRGNTFPHSSPFECLSTQGGVHHYNFYSLFKYGPCRQLLAKHKITSPCSSLKSLVVPETPRT